MLRPKTFTVLKRLRLEDIWFPGLIFILLMVFIVWGWIRAERITQKIEKGEIEWITEDQQR